jgi:hypothetical protein
MTGHPPVTGFLDPPATRYAFAVTELLQGTLGNRLLGVYLHGSGALGDYVPGRSDVDLLAVATGSVPPETTEELAAALWALPKPDPTKGLDLHLVPADHAAAPTRSPAFSLYMLTFHGVTVHAGPDHPGDPRLIMHFVVCRDHGLALSGPHPRKIFAALPRRWFLDELLDELGRIAGTSVGYRVLTACRDWRFLKTGAISSKLAGAEWARSRIANPGLVDAALAWQAQGAEWPAGPSDLAETDALVSFVASMLADAAEGRRHSPSPDDDATCHGPAGPYDHPGPPPESPLVSCLMPVRERTPLIADAVADFLSQDYAHRELIVLDGTEPGVADLLPLAVGVRRIRVDNPSFPDGVRAATGRLLAAWPHLGRYPSWRLSYQVGRILHSGLEVCGCPTLRVPGAPPQNAPERHIAAITACWTRTATLDFAAADPRLGGLPRWALASTSPLLHSCPHLVTVRPEGREGGTHPAAEIARPRWTAPARDRRLVSCVMPTFNRPRFVRQAIRYFQAQEYPDRELIIVDDGPDPVRDVLPDDDRIRYIRLATRTTIGSKRNLACEQARGDVVVQWDDDDWYGPRRIADQVADLVAGRAELTGITQSWLLDLRGTTFWRLDPDAGPGQPEVSIAGGTLAFLREVWGRCGGYPDDSLGEDVGFLRRAAECGARIVRMPNNGAYVYVRHPANSWRFDFPAQAGPPGWSQQPPPPFIPGEDVARYRAMRPAEPEQSEG